MSEVKTDSARRLAIPNNLLVAVILAVPGYLAGRWLGDSFQLKDDLNTGVLLGYTLASIGFLLGLGFLNYPLSRLFGRPVRHLHKSTAGTGVGRYFGLSFDHKVIGIQYLTTILLMMLVGGIGAMFVRTNLLQPSPPIFPPNQYLTMVGLHSVMMIFVASAAIVGPFGNFLVPIMIGSRRMAFPRLEALSFWLVPPAVVILLASVFWGGFNTGWTGYTPLSEQAGQGMDSYIVGFGLIGIAIFISGLNMLTTIIMLRAPG